jgi:hypothetical protein
VITRTAHIQLIDFGSAAPLVPGSRLVPPEYCRVPCGTCDYISPEILQAHEAALVAMELSDEEDEDRREENAGEDGYGAETDWWSAGAMIYEMVFGAAPFFARDIRSTYLKIVDFRKSLAFPTNTSVSTELCDLLTQYVRDYYVQLDFRDRSSCSLLTDAETRLGRHGTNGNNATPFLRRHDVGNLHSGMANLQSPNVLPHAYEQNSTLRTSTSRSSHTTKIYPAHRRLVYPIRSTKHLRLPPPHSHFPPSSSRPKKARSGALGTAHDLQLYPSRRTESFFIGFSWGPTADAFPDGPLTTPPPTPLPLPARVPVPQTPLELEQQRAQNAYAAHRHRRYASQHAPDAPAQLHAAPSQTARRCVSS